MAETEYQRLFASAQDRAFVGFLALLQRAMQEADKNAVTELAGARTPVGQSALAALRHFLRQNGNVFLRRVETLLRNYLERAMQTMYVDLRGDMSKVSADALSLIDDEAVNQQIEVGRLAQRMREADEEGIGRLNVIISQLHGRHEAKERENPFRPYLLARVLHEATREVAPDETMARLLFDYLGNALIPGLSGYYGAIREVFESFGVHGKFIAQQSRAAHFQRYYGAPSDPQVLSAHFNTRVLPGLQRITQALQHETLAAGGAQSAPELIRAMLGSSRGAGPRPLQLSGTRLPAPLLAQLGGYQKQVAQEAAADGAAATEHNRLSALRERLDLDQATAAQRMTVDVVGMLFELILEDEQIAPALRAQIARLQIPLLKAALLDARLLHDDAHPARRLLNRMASAAVDADFSSASGRRLGAEIDGIVGQVLRDFDADMAVFSACLAQFERFLSQDLRGDDGQGKAAEAIETAEKFSILLTNITSELCELLLPMNADKRISDFIIQVWPHVLVRAAWSDRERGIGATHADSAFRMYRALLPDLLWSVQPRHDPQDRNALIRVLPDLVKRLNHALQLVRLPADESRRIMDQLVEMHMQVLRGAPVQPATPQPERQELEQCFARLAIDWDRVSWQLAEPPQPRAELIEEAVARHGVAAALNLGVKTLGASAADREFLAQTYLLGTRVEIRSGDNGQRPAQLAWISAHRSLYLFRLGDGALAIYTSAALLEALRDGAVVPVEYAPVFERAVESLLFGAEKIAGRAG